MGEYADRILNPLLYGDGSNCSWIYNGKIFRPGDKIRSKSGRTTGIIATSSNDGPDWPPCVPVNWDSRPTIECWTVIDDIEHI